MCTSNPVAREPIKRRFVDCLLLCKIPNRNFLTRCQEWRTEYSPRMYHDSTVEIPICEGSTRFVMKYTDPGYYLLFIGARPESGFAGNGRPLPPYQLPTALTSDPGLGVTYDGR